MRYQMTSAWQWLIPVLWLTLLTQLPTPASAGVLELRQGSQEGGGTGFRRGDLCHVLTAAHVVEEGKDSRQTALGVMVLDRSGARAEGQVTFVNWDADVALVTLQPGFAVACNGRWPESDWMSGQVWTPNTGLTASRHYSTGKETVFMLRWAGGTANTINLAHTDKTTIRATDSGSAVMLGERLAGIIKEVDTGQDRVVMVRFDLIDRLVGDRFRGSGAGAVGFDGVFNRGKRHAAWTNYVAAWLTETAGRPVVTVDSAQAACRVRAEVIDWSQRNEVNPRHAEIQQSLTGCKTNLLFRNSKTMIQICENNAREQLKTTPQRLRVHSLQLKVDVTPAAGSTESRLRTVELRERPGASASKADMSLQTMQAAFAQVATDMMSGGNCD